MVAAFQGNPFSNLPPLAASVPSGLQGGTLPLNFTPTSYWTRGSNTPGPTPPPPTPVPTGTSGTTPSGVFDQFAAQRAAATATPQLNQPAQLGTAAPAGDPMSDPRVSEMAKLYADAGKYGYAGFQMPQFDPQAFLRLMGNYGSSGTQGGGETATGNTGAGESPGIGGGIGP